MGERILAWAGNMFNPKRLPIRIWGPLALFGLAWWLIQERLADFLNRQIDDNNVWVLQGIESASEFGRDNLALLGPFVLIGAVLGLVLHAYIDTRPHRGGAETLANGAPTTIEKVKPNVVFDGFVHVREQQITTANISQDPRAEFACLRFVNEPEQKGPEATVPDLHARIEISQSGKPVLKVEDGRWAENVDREQAPGRETKSVPLPGNGETRTLNIVMQRRGEDECYGWSHGGRQIPEPPIPKGSYAVRVELDGSNMETRTFLFELRNNGKEDFLELREAAGFTNPCSARWADERSALAIECRTESGLRLGDERAALAYLVVSSVNQGQIQNAYVKVHRILEHTFQSINKEWRPYTQPLYEHEDIFLRWQATEERYHSFHSEAILNVARGRRGDGRYGLVSHAPNLFPGLQIYDWYEITLDIAADNSPLLKRTLILRMEEPIVEMGGKSVLFPDSPYRIEFREKETGEIMPPPKLDTGESQP